MKIRRANPKLFESPTATVSQTVETPRQRRRRELETALQEAIEGARQDPTAAYQVTLDADEKASGVRTAFKRVRDRVGASDINLVTVDSTLYIAQVPQRRGRRPKAG